MSIKTSSINIGTIPKTNGFELEGGTTTRSKFEMVLGEMQAIGGSGTPSVFTIPNFSGEFIIDHAAQEMSNKTIIDGFEFVDSGDSGNSLTFEPGDSRWELTDRPLFFESHVSNTPVLEIDFGCNSEHNQYGLYITNSIDAGEIDVGIHSEVSSTAGAGVCGEFVASGSGLNYGGWFLAEGGSINYAIYISKGIFRIPSTAGSVAVGDDAAGFSGTISFVDGFGDPNNIIVVNGIITDHYIGA